MLKIKYFNLFSPFLVPYFACTEMTCKKDELKNETIPTKKSAFGR